jgi:hypothetical protein
MRASNSTDFATTAPGGARILEGSFWQSGQMVPWGL